MGSASGCATGACSTSERICAATRSWKSALRRRSRATSEPGNCCVRWRPCILKIRAATCGANSDMAKAKSKAAYMISVVAEQYEIHPQTLRLYEREGLLKPSRSDGNTRLYTPEDLERLEVILHLTRD